MEMIREVFCISTHYPYRFFWSFFPTSRLGCSLLFFYSALFVMLILAVY